MKMSAFCLLSLLVFTLGFRVQAETISIPDHPASLILGPLTIQYPADWSKSERSNGAGFVLKSPQAYVVANQQVNFVVTVRKKPNSGQTLQQYKDFVSNAMRQTTKNVNEQGQKLGDAKPGEKGATVQASNIGKWSVETEHHGDVEVLRNDVVSTNELNGKPAVFHTHGMSYVTPDAIYSMSFTYPVSLESECGPFADWLMKHVTITP